MIHSVAVQINTYLLLLSECFHNRGVLGDMRFHV